MPIHYVLALGLLNGASARAAPRVSLPLYALALGAQPLVVGMLAATFSVLPMLLSVQAGQLVDRFGARWLLLWGGLVGVLGMLIPFFVPGLAAVFMAATVAGAAAGVCEVALQNLVGLLSTQQSRALNFSNYSLMGSISNFVGPLMAGFSIDLSGHPATCLYLALCALVPVAMVTIWGGALPAGTRQVKHAEGGARDMLSEPGVRRTLATSSLLQTGKDIFQFYMPVYMHAIGMSASIIGVVISMNAVAAFVVRSVLPRLIARFKEEKMLAFAFYLSAVSLMLIPFFEDAVTLALISFVFGLGMGAGQPIITLLMFSNSAEGRSGEALGLRMTVIHLTKIVVPVAFGSVGSALGLPPVFWLNAVMLGTGGLLSRPGTIVRSGRRR